MNCQKTIWVLALGLLLLSTAGADNALAQRRGGGGGGLAGPIELSATYGSMWGGNIQLYNGTVRSATGPSYGGVLSIPVSPAQSVELNYTHQDGALDWDSRGTTEKLTDMSVNYWQIGSTRLLAKGRIQPFVLGSLGATYYTFSESEFAVEGETIYTNSMTKFSLGLGLGFKTFFGEAEKVGLRFSFKTTPTFYNTSGGFWFGTGGASVGVTGSTVWQWEVAGGLTVRLGG